jgi:hypothetical protein
MLKSLKSGQEKQLKMPYSRLALSMEYVGITIKDPDYWYWCVSPIWGEDEKVHLFCSRWPVGGEMTWWETVGEIVHLIGDCPEGPFTLKEIVLNNDMLRNPKRYRSPHNPHIKKIDDTYVLTFILHDMEIGRCTGMSSAMMFSDTLDGPWTFYGEDGVVVRPSKNENHWTYGSVVGTDNPTFMKIEDQYYLFFKAGKCQNGLMHYGYAVAETLTGPYSVCDEPKMDNVDYTEDAMCFEQDGKIWMLTTDNMGGNTGIWGAGILWEMRDGFFSLENAKIGFGVLSDYCELPDKTTFFAEDYSTKLERPAVLLTDGKPSHFYGCTRTSILGTNKSECYIFKITNE